MQKMNLRIVLFVVFMSMTVIAFSQTYGNLNTRTEECRNSDGTVTYTQYSNCMSCGGRGQCRVCGGRGGSLYSFCSRCNGGGHCVYCNGLGVRLLSSYTTLPEEKFDGVNYKKLHNGYEEVARGDNFEMITTYTQCTKCSGTNKCNICRGQGSQTIAGEIRICYICNGGAQCTHCDHRGMQKVVRTADYKTGMTTYYNANSGYYSVDYIDVNSFALDYKDDYATVPEDEYRGKLSPEQYRQRYAEWEDKARFLYESLVDVLNTSSGDEVHINKHKANESVLYQSGMRELLIRSQGQMRKVRSEAAFYGVTIMQSHWETCSPPSRY